MYYYNSSDWSVTSTVAVTGSHRDITFTYIGSDYYTLNLAPYEAFKIAQFARLADLTVNNTNFDYETRFTWVSKQSLDGFTENDDDYDVSLDDIPTRDYSIMFIGATDYIANPVVEHKPNLGEIYVDNTSVGMTSLYQVCIRNVNPIGTGLGYVGSKVFDYIDSDWTVSTSVSPYDITKLDYFFTYSGAGNKYLFTSGNRFLLAKFSQTVNRSSSNINTSSYILTLEEPLDSGSITDNSIIDKIHVNTIASNGELELLYGITLLRYFKSQALFDYQNSNWTIASHHGLRRIEIQNVNLHDSGLLANTGLNVSDWTASTTTSIYDATLKNVILEYTGITTNYGYTGADIATFFKLFDRALASALSNMNEFTVVQLKVVTNNVGPTPTYYDMSGYLVEIDVTETVEYIGCAKMLNYNPLSGLFKLNGTLDRITAMSTLSLLNVNLTIDSDYAGTGTAWNLTADDGSGFGIYKDLTIEYTGGSDYDIATSVIEHVCKFYKVYNSLYGSEINVDTPVRIALADIPGSSGSGNAYIDLITVSAGVEYWSSGNGYLEYTAGQAMFSVNPAASLDALPTIKKFIIENVNANASGVYGLLTLTDWTITSDDYDLIAEYIESGAYTLSVLIDIFLLTRTATLGSPSNIDDDTEIRVYMNYDNTDDEENYFADVLASDGLTEYIDGISVIEYSKYYGMFKILNNTVLTSVDSIEFFDVNVDHTTSIYDEFTVSGVTATKSSTSPGNAGVGAFNIKFDWGGIAIPTSSEFVRFNRLGNSVTMDDTSDSNISDTSVFHFMGTDSFLASVDIYLSLITVSDPSDEEYYSKRNYIEYYANLGELRLRRSILDSIFAVELVAIDVTNVHFVNPGWTASSGATSGPGGGSSGAYDLKLTYVSGEYTFPAGDVDDEITLCTFYGITSNIDIVNTQVRLYIKNASDAAETENVINKTGAESLIATDGINYYMTTGTIKVQAPDSAFDEIYKLVLYGVNVNADCIFSRTFTDSAAWTITTTANFYNSDYVDFSLTYNGTTPYVVAGEAFLFQFFDTITRTIGNAGLLNSMASGSAKETPVTWYSSDSSIGITGYFIADKDFIGSLYSINVSTAYDSFISYDTITSSKEIKFTVGSTLYSEDIVAAVYTDKDLFFGAVVIAMNTVYSDDNFLFSDKMILSYTDFTFNFSSMVSGLSNTIIGNIVDVPALPPTSYEYYSENKRYFKYYNNLGRTDTVSVTSPRVASIESITLLDVNFSTSQVYSARTATTISTSSIDAETYKDFTITFGSTHTTTSLAVELLTVYDFYDINLVDYLMNNNTIALLYDGTTTFPIRTVSAENPEYYKMDGLVNYYGSNGDFNFMKKSYGGDTTTQVYKIEMEMVNATIDEVIIEYSSWTASSRRIGSLYTLTFTFGGGASDTFSGSEDFINIALLLGYYSSVYGSSLINKDTVVTITFNSALTMTTDDQIARGKLVRLVSDPTDYDVTFTDRAKYPVPTNLYSQYKEYNLIFLTGDARKAVPKANTFISVFDRFVLTGSSGKTQEATFEANASKVQMVRYTVLKSKTAPYNFSCEESGYTSFNIDANSVDLGTIAKHLVPQKNIPSNSIAISLMNNTLGGGNHTLYEILDSVIIVTISDYDGTRVSPTVSKILKDYGTMFGTFDLTVGDCYMCVLFVNRKFENTKDLATFSRINQSGFSLSQRQKNTIVYENTASTKLVISIPYAQMSTYMKYHYESIRNAGNTVRLPVLMLLNAERTLNNYRKNAIVYDVDVLS
jgi:hypothetical protein